jgi:hypothetical protein
MMIDLIHELIGGTDLLTVKRKRIVPFSPVTEEIVSSANLLGDKHMKAFLEFPPILNLICLALCHGEQEGSPRRIGSSPGLLDLKFSN